MITNKRINILALFFIFLNIIILVRLFYWQVILGNKIREMGWKQYHFLKNIPAFRGSILASDEFPLAASQKAYSLYVSLSKISSKTNEVIDRIIPILLPLFKEKQIATDSSFKDNTYFIEKLKENLNNKFNNNQSVWISLEHKLQLKQKKEIEKLKIKGLEFEEEQNRFYPEASMAAHLLGFVGKDKNSQDKGYFGLEGFYNLELKGRPGVIFQEKDATNNPILIGSFINQQPKDGKNLILYLDRSIQFIVEKKLKEAVEKYKAKSGYVIVLDPKTGGVLAMASFPSYNPRLYFKFDKSLFKNPAIANAYEPGSTFKIFVMAAAIDKGLVKPETKCDICDKPFKIDKYIIRTWNNKYYPGSTMKEVIQHSDNVGMVFVGQKLKIDRFWQYLKAFGFGEKTNIDLQEEIAPSLKRKNKWNKVDLATASFGQGIMVTGIQVVRAAAAIANGGKLVKPMVVKEIISGSKRIKLKSGIIKKIIKTQTADTITKMMVNSVENGEAKWVKLPGYKIAGKTGTAQIAVNGHYDQQKTIASFIGFAPAEKPKFVMLTVLREPQTSPWGAETAAPLFFKIAKEILLYYNVQPN